LTITSPLATTIQFVGESNSTTRTLKTIAVMAYIAKAGVIDRQEELP
jgi:hypothetical protein